VQTRAINTTEGYKSAGFCARLSRTDGLQPLQQTYNYGFKFTLGNVVGMDTAGHVFWQRVASRISYSASRWPCFARARSMRRSGMSQMSATST
jgi:hypothetical protein